MKRVEWRLCCLESTSLVKGSAATQFTCCQAPPCEAILEPEAKRKMCISIYTLIKIYSHILN